MMVFGMFRVHADIKGPFRLLRTILTVFRVDIVVPPKFNLLIQFITQVATYRHKVVLY